LGEPRREEQHLLLPQTRHLADGLIHLADDPLRLWQTPEIIQRLRQPFRDDPRLLRTAHRENLLLVLLLQLAGVVTHRVANLLDDRDCPIEVLAFLWLPRRIAFGRQLSEVARLEAVDVLVTEFILYELLAIANGLEDRERRVPGVGVVL